MEDLKSYVLVGEYERRVAAALRVDLETLRRAMGKTHFNPSIN